MLKRHITDTSSVDLTSYIQSHNLAWSEITLYVKLHKKQIYEFSRIGDTLTVHTLQKELFTSKEACILALRHVLNTKSQYRFSFKYTTNDFLFFNSDKLLKSLACVGDENDHYRLNLVIQELLIMVFRPEWEARLEENSYGFSSNLIVNQAIIKAYSILSENKTYDSSTILVGSLSEWFQTFNYSLALKKSNCSAYFKRYLESICCEFLLSSSRKLVSKKFQSIGITVFPYNSIPSLLSDILFYGLEMSLHWKSKIFCDDSSKYCDNNIKTIVCCDHFIVIFPHNDLKWISLIVNAIKSFFDSLSITLHNSSMTVRSIHDGFDFLGFNFKRYYNEGGCDYQQTKLILKPSKSNIKKHLLSIRHCLYHKDRLNRWRANTQMTQYDVINQLNPLIKDFSHYYRDLIPSYILNTLDRTLNQVIYRYAIKRYKSNKSQKWTENWTTVVNGKKVIAYKNDTSKGYKLLYLHNQNNYSQRI
nr:mat [Erythrotrichia foliiformis]